MDRSQASDQREADTAVKFISGIIHRFGIPHSIITDNGSNFTADVFKEFCQKRRIHIDYTSVAHPQSNGQVEWANGLIMQGLKPRLITPLIRAQKGSGSTSSPQSFGACGQPRTDPSGILRSSWSMGQRQSYPLT